MSTTLDNPQVIIIGGKTVSVKNVSYLGRCYDLKALDPLDLSKAPGTKIKMAIDLDVSDATPTGGNLIPVGTDYAPGSGGSFDEETSMLFTSYDFQKRFSQTVSVGLDIGVAAFSASTTYEHFLQETTTQKSLFTYTEVLVRDFTLGLVLEDHYNPALTLASGLQQFRDRVAALPTESGPAYDAFIRDFGTHFGKQVVFGGRAHQNIEIQATSYMRLEREGIKVDVEAKGTFKGATGSVGSSTETEQSKTFKEETEEGQQSVVYSGGTVNSDFDTWAASVREDPAPVELQLAPLSDLMNASFFPSDGQITRKAEIMREAVSAYLNPPDMLAPALTAVLATSFKKAWDDKGSGNGGKDARWWRANGDDLPEGFHPVGDTADIGYHSDCRSPLLLLKDVQPAGSAPALLPPVDWQRIWEDKGSGADNDGAFWLPVAPEGYVAMGLATTRDSHNRPSDATLAVYRCVRADLVVPGKTADWVWDSKDSGADTHFSCWRTAPADGYEGEDAGTVFCWTHYHRPEAGEALPYPIYVFAKTL